MRPAARPLRTARSVRPDGQVKVCVMSSFVDNSGETDYQGKLQQIARQLTDWQGDIVLVSHVDPDGDALGSTLALKRALAAMGKQTSLAMVPPPYLEFLLEPDELLPRVDSLGDNTLLCVLDVADRPRVDAISLETMDTAAFTINIDHHGTNDRFGDLALVQPSKAATCQIVKDLIDQLGVTWTAAIATPCLTGLITDTGSFRFSNTDSSVLTAASDLLLTGLDYGELADRLQWRPKGYYQLLGLVLGTLTYPLDGLAAFAWLTPEMEAEVTAEKGDSDDFVGTIRYAEGTQLAIFLKAREDHTKVSVRSRAPVSAQNICVELGGGGHVAAAGAKVMADLEATTRLVLEATERELRRTGHIS